MKNLILNVAAIIIVTSLICYSCKKSDDSPANSNKIELGNTTVDSVSYSWIKVSTQFNSTGGNQIIQHGYCWGTNSGPNLDNAHSSLGSTSNAISFTGKPEGLNENTLYYIRPYASYSGGTIFGSEVTALTLKTGKPNVVTANISELTLYSAVSGGTVLNDSGKIITACGICWDLQQSPDINNHLGITNDGSGTGEFQSSMTDLSENTEYFVRAYATNANGTSYGEVISFITAELFFPNVNTTQISNITINSVDCSGEVLDAGNGNVYQKGVCWGTTNDITLTNCMGYSEEGSGIGSFTTNITGLNHGTVYYVKAYATNEKGTGYGEAVDFATLSLDFPEVSTTEITNISYNSASGGGNVISDGNGNISARGVCWGTDPSPTLLNAEGFTEDGTGTGEFTSALTNLNHSTTYYVAAYATNEMGTAYGAVVSFPTLVIELPSVETASVSNILFNTAQSGGIVNSSGSGSVVARGVCWDINPNPRLESCLGYTTDDSGIGDFVSILTNLAENTVYYVCAYATNTYNVSGYGDDEVFETLESCGVISYAGREYNTIVIGDQCWMAENLNVGTTIDCEQEQSDNGLMEKYCYEDLESNCDVYGGLYQWNEAMQYSNTSGARGICPSGWHIPTDNEWKILEGFVDSQYGIGNAVWDQTGYRGHDAGLNLKSIEGWFEYGNGLDLFGFNALPAGLRTLGGNNMNLTRLAYFYTSDQPGPYTAYSRWFYDVEDRINRSEEDRNYGFSIRCIKD